MIKKNLIFPSLFLVFVSIWIIVILNVLLNTYSISFLTSPSSLPFGGFFGLFYWLIVGISSATSLIFGLDKLGLPIDIWKKLSIKNKSISKPKIILTRKKPKTNPIKRELQKEQVTVTQNKVSTGITDINKTQKQTDNLKAFYLYGETKFKKCFHKFGYLGKTLKNKPIPDECFGCPQLLECFKQTKNSKKKKPELTTII